MLAEVLQGNGWLAIAAAAVLVGALVLEGRLVRTGSPLYYALTFPLGAELVPLPYPPRTEGAVGGPPPPKRVSKQKLQLRI